MVRLLLLAWALTLLCVSPARASCSPEATHALGSAASHWGLDVTVLTALAFVESSCNPRAVNRSSGSVGLLQILVGGGANPWAFTAAELLNPWLNADLGARYLVECLRRCGTMAKALGRYHGNKRGCVADGFSKRVMGIANSERKS